MRKKILFLMMELDSASGICVQNVARELSGRGYEIHILTKSPEKKVKPYQTEYGARVHGVTAGWLDRICWKCDRSASHAGKSLGRLMMQLQRAKVVFCYPTWPLKDFVFSRRLTKKAKEMARKEKIDIVIPAYNTIDALIAADAVKRADPNILYVPYMLDAFYGGQTPRLMTEKQKRKKALRWENRLFARSDGVVMMNPARDSYAKDGIRPEYLDRTVFLDLPMLQEASVPDCGTKHPGETVFLFAGSMPRNIRDPKYLLELFRSMAQPHWRLWFVGPSDFESLIDEAAAADSRIRRIGRVSHSQAQSYMATADYLVNIGNTLAYMVPSKIFEYMSFGKPVISTVKIPNDPCQPYLKLYDRALILDEQAPLSQNADVLIRFVREMQEKESATIANLTKPGMPLYANTPAAFADYIQSLTEKMD